MKFPVLFLVLALAFPGLVVEGAERAKPNVVVLIADDWSWPHAGFFGDRVVRTPNIDRIAREGVVFTNAFCAAPSCTASRGAILTGRYPHQLEEGGNLWSSLPAKFPVYPDLLEKAGYVVGHTRKGWSPGNFREGGRERNPAGPGFKNFGAFLEQAEGKPFCFWFGSQDPHRPYQKGDGLEAGLDPSKVTVPGCWPDRREVREDMLDYYFEVERFDRNVGELVALLEEKGLLANTVLIVTGDNGMPFPRAKANVYDLGARVPLIVSWPARFKPRVASGFINLAQIAPTVCDLAGVERPGSMTLKSFRPVLEGDRLEGSDQVFLERERHANVRKGDLSYPMRAVRTAELLYIRNLRPDRWPAGDPEMHHSVGPYGDVDASPTKKLIVQRGEDGSEDRYFKLAFGKRPAEELYHLASDPAQTNNVAGKVEFREAKRELERRLKGWMEATKDPRLDGETDVWSEYPFYGPKGTLD